MIPTEQDDAEVGRLLTQWKDRVLHRAAMNIENHFFNKPTDELSAEERGQ